MTSNFHQAFIFVSQNRGHISRVAERNQKALKSGPKTTSTEYFYDFKF